MKKKKTENGSWALLLLQGGCILWRLSETKLLWLKSQWACLILSLQRQQRPAWNTSACVKLCNNGNWRGSECWRRRRRRRRGRPKIYAVDQSIGEYRWDTETELFYLWETEKQMSSEAFAVEHHMRFPPPLDTLNILVTSRLLAATWTSVLKGQFEDIEEATSLAEAICVGCSP